MNTGFVTKIEEFDNGFVAHGLFGLVASDITREGAIEKLRKLTERHNNMVTEREE